jgi:hypothetical protein
MVGAGGSDRQAKKQRARDQESQAPGCRGLAVVVMPELGREQRAERDRQQQPGERYAPPGRQALTPEFRSRGEAGREDGRQRGAGRYFSLHSGLPVFGKAPPF